MKFNLFKIIFISLVGQMVCYQTSICQTGFAKKIRVEDLILDIDDIAYHKDQLIIRGNTRVDSVNLFGLLLAGIDTTGTLLWYKTIVDSDRKSNIITNTPSRFIISDEGKILVPTKYLNTNRMVFFITDSVGNIFSHHEYHDGLNIRPQDIIEHLNSKYIFGTIQQNNYLSDVFVMKTDSIGTFRWIKYYGSSNYGESFGDVIDNHNGTMTISANQYTPDYFDPYTIQGWRKPWIFTIDTSGTIIKEWKGQQNDSRTLGGGPFYKAANGDWIMASYELKQVLVKQAPYVYSSPTITRLDSNYNLIWKKNLTGFTSQTDLIRDMEYDSVRDEFIATGDLLVWYSSSHAESEAWIFKFSSGGEILWDVTDTVSYGHHEYHYVAGVALSPSGSAYVAGYVNTTRSDGWIIKVTPDGCTDTICTTTSIQEQIKSKSESVLVYPNPTTGDLNIHFNDDWENNGEIELRVIDETGREKYKDHFPGGEKNHSLSMEEFPPGIYLLTLESGKKWFTTKVVRL